jgi:K(+)-stimulated pyrophosphate-energized sodium pump
MFTVGMGLLGATVIIMLYGLRATDVLLGFGFGGCLLALFMRVGGGIYTKAADVGADLVGKVEAGIPEDDPRNAAVIADLVGDNVGDCAGMAADIFESYEVTLVASLILGMTMGAPKHPGDSFDFKWIMFPLIVRSIGVLTSMLGTTLVKSKPTDKDALSPILRGFNWAAFASAALLAVVTVGYLHGDWRLFAATCAGLVLAVIISHLTEYYTATRNAPVREIAESSLTGAATNILSGFAYGLESSVMSILLICLTMLASLLIFRDAGPIAVLYGVSLCGLGMLTTTGVIVAEDSYGPVADNANGIAEMSGIGEAEPQTQKVLDELDAVGNTTKATTKGFAIATAVIAAVSLFGSFLTAVAGGGAHEAISAEALAKHPISVSDPIVLIGLLIGGAMPFLFSSMTIRAVGRAAFMIINEVRRQFREIPGLMEGKAMPDSGRCVDICTSAAIRELVGPGLLAILAPVIVGCFFNWQGLGGYLAGIIMAGQLLAVMLANAGGAWDNAKKYIEDGHFGGKGSDPHKAAVVGDTVGDPFKDTAGPALNPLIKVMNLVALLIIPVIVKAHNTDPVMAYFAGAILLVIVVYAVWRAKQPAFEHSKAEAQLGPEMEALAEGLGVVSEPADDERK